MERNSPQMGGSSDRAYGPDLAAAITAAVALFLFALPRKLPPLARLASVSSQELPALGSQVFDVQVSDLTLHGQALVPVHGGDLGGNAGMEHNLQQ